MGKTVEVYKNECWSGEEVVVSDIINDYPFLKNENFDSAVITIKPDQITFEYRDNTDADVVVWKRNNMTGAWVDRIIFV